MVCALAWGVTEQAAQEGAAERPRSKREAHPMDWQREMRQEVPRRLETS